MNRLSIGFALLVFVADATCTCGRAVTVEDTETVTWPPQSSVESENDRKNNVTREDHNSKPPCMAPTFSSSVTHEVDNGVYTTFRMYFDFPNQRTAVHGLPDDVTEVLKGFEDQSSRGLDYFSFTDKICLHLVMSDETIEVPCVPDAAQLTTKVKVGASTFQLWTQRDDRYLFEDVTGYPVITDSLVNNPFSTDFHSFSDFVPTVDPTKFDIPPFCNGTNSQTVTAEQLVKIRRKLYLIPGRRRNLQFLRGRGMVSFDGGVCYFRSSRS
jgi:hypothetical protein